VRIRSPLIARGSAGECWAQLLIGIETGLVVPIAGKAPVKEADELARMLRGLAKHFEDQRP